jgi:hypothetical protein
MPGEVRIDQPQRKPKTMQRRKKKGGTQLVLLLADADTRSVLVDEESGDSPVTYGRRNRESIDAQ